MSNAQECYRRPSKYRDFIMLSEWLVDIPDNFATDYYAMPTPVGKRCLVVADGGKSLLFGRNGKLLERFISVLPGGSRDTSNKGYAILDVIVNYENDTIYIVDMVAWRNQSHIQCETEFRFEWLKARLEESDVDVSVTSANNQYKFQRVPVYPCDNASLARMMELPFSFEVALDGVMFYHRQGHYTHGQTPLVGWLKPFMFGEILGVPVPEKFQSERPSEYTNLSQHIEYGKASRIARLERNAETKEKCRLEKLKKQQDRQAANNEQGEMDCENVSEEQAREGNNREEAREGNNREEASEGPASMDS